MNKLFFLLFISIILFVTSCSPIISETPEILSELSAETQDREILEGNAEIKIPQNATEISDFTSGLNEISTLVRFTIAPGETQEFLNSIICNPSAVLDFPPQFKGGFERTWWKPDAAKEYQWCEGSGDNISQSVFIDISNSDYYIVYVIASTY